MEFEKIEVVLPNGQPSVLWMYKTQEGQVRAVDTFHYRIYQKNQRNGNI